VHVIATASVRRPPSGPPPFPRDAARSAGILAAATAAVVLATLALSVLIVPRPPGPTVATPTSGIEMDLGAAPTAIGGQLVVTGDRPGTLTIASERSAPGYEPDSSVAGGLAFDRGEITLSGPQGEVVISPRTGEITRIEYDGLSFYLDPGDCSATSGGRNAALGLLHVEVRCQQITDLREGAVIGLEGVISVPADALGDRGDLPPVGGSVQVGQDEVEIVQGVALVGGFGPVDDGLVPLLVPASDVTGLGIVYDPEDGTYALSSLQVEGVMVELVTPCPIPSEELGRLNPQTTVVRLAVDCDGVTLPQGGTGAVAGSLVVDMVALGEGG
jgi:hypothetical protein